MTDAATSKAGNASDTTAVVAVLLAAAAVVAATIGFRSAILGDSGSDTFHGAVREDVKRGSGIVEDVRFVYEEEAPAALGVAAERIQAEETGEAARGSDGEIRGLVQTEANKHQGILETMLEASAIASDPEYARGDGFDVIARLADVRAENPELLELDPDATEDLGAERSRKAALLMAATIPAGLAFLCGALAQGFPSRRRVLLYAGFASVAAAVVAAVLFEVLV